MRLQWAIINSHAGVTTNAALAAKNTTRTIPIVFLGVTDPVAAGLVDSLAHPGGNRTGIIQHGIGFDRQTFGVNERNYSQGFPCCGAVGSSRRLAPHHNGKKAKSRHETLRLQLHSMATSSANDIESAFREATKAHSNALAVTLNPMANSNQKRIASLAINTRLPAICARARLCRRLRLMSYGPGYGTEGRDGADMSTRS